MKLLLLSQKDMENVFSMKDAIQADKEALASYSKGSCNIPLRANLDIKKQTGQSLYMMGYEETSEALGVKIVSVYPKNIEKGLNSVPATMVLLNNETGEVCALLDGTYLTRVRTGAVSGLATDILSRKDSSVFAMFGTGGQAREQLLAVLTVRNIKTVYIYDINEERKKEFVVRMSQEFSKKFNVEIIAADSSDHAVENADIITTVTTSSKPVFDGKKVKQGAHINGVGSYTPSMQEIDEYIISKADKIYVDTRNGALNETGDLIIPMNNKKITESNITGELGEVINGTIAGRKSDLEITVFETTGSAIMDLVTAKKIYLKALENNAGNTVSF